LNYFDNISIYYYQRIIIIKESSSSKNHHHQRIIRNVISKLPSTPAIDARTRPDGTLLRLVFAGTAIIAGITPIDSPVQWKNHEEPAVLLLDTRRQKGARD
jgi:hypothetical protein